MIPAIQRLVCSPACQQIPRQDLVSFCYYLSPVPNQDLQEHLTAAAQGFRTAKSTPLLPAVVDIGERRAHALTARHCFQCYNHYRPFYPLLSSVLRADGPKRARGRRLLRNSTIPCGCHLGSSVEAQRELEPACGLAETAGKLSGNAPRPTRNRAHADESVSRSTPRRCMEPC